MRGFPEIITSLPEADLELAGAKVWLLQGRDCQVCFFDVAPEISVAPHSHGAQWGVIVEGEVELTIGGETRVLRRGDTYFIPAGVMHSGRTLARLLSVDLFGEPGRYRPKGA